MSTMLSPTRSVCWAFETRGSWQPVPPAVAYEPLSANADWNSLKLFKQRNPSVCNSSHPADPRCHVVVNRFAWTPYSSPGQPLTKAVTKETVCEAMRRAGATSLRFLGDSIMRNQVHSIWSLTGVAGHNLGQGPGTRTLRCGSGEKVDILWNIFAGASDFPELLAAVRNETVHQLTVINFGAHVPSLHNYSLSRAFLGFLSSMDRLRNEVAALAAKTAKGESEIVVALADVAQR